MNAKISTLLLSALAGCGQLITADASEGVVGLDAAIVGMDGAPDAADVMDSSTCGPYFVQAVTSGNVRVPSAVCISTASPNLFLTWQRTWFGGNEYSDCRISSGSAGGIGGGIGMGAFFSGSSLIASGQFPVRLGVYTTYRPRPDSSPEPRCYWSSDTCLMQQDPLSNVRVLFDGDLVSRCVLQHRPETSVRGEECGQTVTLESFHVRGLPVTQDIFYSGRDAAIPPDAPPCL